MKNFKISFLTLLSIFLIFSCSDQFSDLGNNEELSSLSSSNELLTPSILDNVANSAKGKDERACITQNKAGIECFKSVGSSCSKLHACEPVPDQSPSGEKFFTEAELADWLNVDYKSNEKFMKHMRDIGWYDDDVIIEGDDKKR